MNSRKENSFMYTLKMAISISLSAFVVFIFINIIFMTIDLFKMKDSAYELKDNLQEVLTCIKEKDYEGAIKATDKMEITAEKMEKTLDTPAWKVAAKIPVVGDYVNSAFNIVDILNVTADEILRPTVNTMNEYPLDNLKAGDGMFNVDVIRAYIILAEQIDPAIDQIIVSIDGINLPSNMNGMVDEYMGKLNSLTKTYEESEDFIPLLKALIGDGEDKTYILAAQNSSEIRASGGFPGSIGSIEIRDGILSIGDFKSVYNVLYVWTSAEAGVTATEEKLFGSWMYNPRDAVFDPDFERVALIWALAYEKKNGVEVDGVVSLTPTIIQSLLQYIGEITLSDGTVLDGSNATKVLQHDLYYKYLSSATVTSGSDDIADQLFAETAKITMSRLVEDFSLERIAGYLKIFRKGADNRTIQMWMKDEDSQEIIRKAGVSGGLNSDENYPQVGVYFSLSDPCKMGWYLDMFTEVGEPVVNEDGTRTYDVKVTLSNTLSAEELRIAGGYIIGSYSGGIRGYLHIFAPAGGQVSDFKTSNSGGMYFDEYQGLQVAYKFGIPVDRGRDYVVTFKVTTAPGVTTPLGVSQTPTLTDYR